MKEREKRESQKGRTERQKKQSQRSIKERG
jgi:hypothetical protein